MRLIGIGSERLTLLVCVVCLLWAGFAQGEGSPSTQKLGKKIDRVPLTDAAGKPFALSDLKDKKAIVVVFLSFDCPVSTSYSQPLSELARTYGERGASFLGICASEDDATQLNKHLRDYKIRFPVYLDPQHAAADAFKAEITPEAFVLDSQFILRYRGRIDDGYSARLKRNLKITHHDLSLALDEILAGKPVSEPATQAIGCPISHHESARPATGAVTFYGDVLPILQNQCQVCHRPGEVGPFSLLSYRHTVNWSSDIKEYTQSRKMPPWKPVDGPAFHNERRLSDKEIATLSAWVDGGTPAGDAKEAPPPRQFPEGWQIGKPDLVLTVDGDFQVGPSGPDIFRCFVLPTTLPEDKYVVAMEVRPGNPRVVHHALTFLDINGAARKLEQAEKKRDKKATDLDVGPGYSTGMAGVGFQPVGGLAGWAPGQRPRYLPEGAGYFLPKGADVVVQLHYHRDGRIEKDRTSIGLYLAKKPVEKRYQSIVVGGAGRLRFFAIPAGAEHHCVQGSLWVEQDCTLHSVMAHMHLIGREIKVTITSPNGPAKTLLAIKDWDYNWQETYYFKEPIAVKADTRFDIEAYYDNSAANPNNPNSPPRVVTFGQQTTDEMCFGFLGVTSDKPGRIKVRFQEKPKQEEPKPGEAKKQ